jgi:hypothetical protein
MKGRFHAMMKRFTDVWWGERGLTTLLVLVLAFLLLSPLIQKGIGDLIINIFFSLLLLSGVTTVSSRKLPRITSGLVAVLCIILNWLKNFNPSSRPLQSWSDLITLCYLLILTLVVIRHVFQEGAVTAGRVRGAVVAYILVGFSFSILYRLIELQVPGSFHLTDAASGLAFHSRESEFTYFSFITMTTLGYGDITPVNPAARMFVIFEALIGQLYPATLLARLVSLQIMHGGDGSKR